MAATWGDPDKETFAKKHIREARAAGVVALVNAKIVDVVARLLEELTAHVDIPDGRIVSHDLAGTDAQRLGLALHLALPLPPSPELAAVVGQWGFDGFAVEGSDLVELRFAGTPSHALTMNEAAIALHLDRLDHASVSGPAVVEWPGVRDLDIGDTGKDVEFLRRLFGVGAPTHPVADDLLQVIRRFQARRGAPVTGVIDVDFWRRLLPAGRPHVAQSDSGMLVRILQAALATYEGATTTVTGVWGVLTSRDVTALQKEYNLRVGSFVRAPEWALLLGPEIPRLDEARRVARGVGVVRDPASLVPETAPSVQSGLNPVAGLPAAVSRPAVDVPPSAPQQRQVRRSAPRKASTP